MRAASRSVAREDGPGTIEFSVRDTGRGIPPQAMAMLFEPFRRRQKERDYAFSGSGLGLSICRKLVEAMKSDLKVETAHGHRHPFLLHARPASDRDGGGIVATSRSSSRDLALLHQGLQHCHEGLTLCHPAVSGIGNR